MDWSRENIIRRFQLLEPPSYDIKSLKPISQRPDGALRKAAVLVGFIERETGCSILFTKRADHLKHHPGQISFPGGRYEEYDESLYATALRETDEEIGISPHYVDIFGTLPELVTTSGYLVTPVLAKITPSFSLNVDTNEVQDVFEIPAEYLLNRKNLTVDQFSVNGHSRKIFLLPYRRHLIWGVTGQIIDILQRQFSGLK